MEETYGEIFKIRFRQLLDICKENGVQQQEIADALGISKQALTSWKNGDRSPRLPMVRRVAEYFGVSVSYLTGIEDKIPGQVSLLDFAGISLEGGQEESEIKAQARKSAKRMQLESLIRNATEDQLDLLINLVQAVVSQRKP